MLEWGFVGVFAGIIYVTRQLSVIATELDSLRADVAALQKEFDRKLNVHLRTLTDVIEIHLDIPEEKSIFRSGETK